MWQFGLSALRSPTVARVSLRTLGWARSLFYSTVAQTATFVAVDKVTDLVLQKEANEEPTIAEMALDLMLAAFIYRKGGKAFNAARSRATQIRTTDRAKFSNFAGSLGRTPIVDVTAFGSKFVSFLQSKRPSVTWAFSKKTGSLHMFGKGTGRYYGSVSNSGISIPGVKKLKDVAVVLQDPKVRISAAGLTTAGLSLLADTMFFLVDEVNGVDSKDVRSPDDSELADKLSFIRDPDYWIDQFGGAETPPDVALERALGWFLDRGSDGAEIIEVDDVSDEEALAMEAADEFVKAHVDTKTGNLSDEALVELADDDRVADISKLQCDIGHACTGIPKPYGTTAKPRDKSFSYHAAYTGETTPTRSRVEKVPTVSGLQ